MFALSLAAIITPGDPSAAEKFEFIKLEATRWVEAGVMSELDRKRYFNYVEAFEWDRQEMIKRLSEMDADCPQEWELYRLPPESEAREAYSISRRHEGKLLDMMPYLAPNQQVEYEKILEEYKRRSQFWWKLWACWDNCSGKGTRLNLQDLRSFMGREGYDKAEWLSPTLQIDY